MNPVSIDWSDLETALDTNLPELTHYLDTYTGQVIMHSSDLGKLGYGEDIEIDLTTDRYVRIDALPSRDQYAIMEDFVETLPEGVAKTALQRAMHGHGAFRRFKDTLFAYPTEQQRWYAFKDAAIQLHMNEWLAVNDIEPSNPRDPLPVPGPHNEMAENPIAELQEMVSELTLLLVYLTSWEEPLSGKLTVRKAWKGYTFDTLNALEDRGLIHQSRKAKSVMLTDEGIALARDLLKRFHP